MRGVSVGVVLMAAMLAVGCSQEPRESTGSPLMDAILADRDAALARYGGAGSEQLIHDYPSLAKQLANDPETHDATTVREMASCHSLGVALWALGMMAVSDAHEVTQVADDAVKDFSSLIFGLPVTSDLQTYGVTVVTALDGLAPRLTSLSRESLERFENNREFGRMIREDPALGDFVATEYQAFVSACKGFGVDVAEQARPGI